MWAGLRRAPDAAFLRYATMLLHAGMPPGESANPPDGVQYVANGSSRFFGRSVWRKWRASFRKRNNRGILPLRLWQFIHPEPDWWMGELCHSGSIRTLDQCRAAPRRIVGYWRSGRIAHGPLSRSRTRLRAKVSRLMSAGPNAPPGRMAAEQDYWRG
jgi:hypothetical protein